MFWLGALLNLNYSYQPMRKTSEEYWVLFDNDGVLVDTEPIFKQITVECLRLEGYLSTDQQWLELYEMQGRGLIDALVTDASARERITAQRDYMYFDTIRTGVPLVEGALDALHELKRSFRLAIVTGATRSLINLQYQNSIALDLFDGIIAREDYSEVKPAADPYICAMQTFGCLTNKSIVVEDSIRGVESANAAGLECIRFCPAGLAKGAISPGIVQGFEKLLLVINDWRRKT